MTPNAKALAIAVVGILIIQRLSLDIALVRAIKEESFSARQAPFGGFGKNWLAFVLFLLQEPGRLWREWVILPLLGRQLAISGKSRILLSLVTACTICAGLSLIIFYCCYLPGIFDSANGRLSLLAILLAGSLSILAFIVRPRRAWVLPAALPFIMVAAGGATILNFYPSVIFSAPLAGIEHAPDESLPTVLDTDVPIKELNWRRIVVHSSPQGKSTASCHFAVLGGPGANGSLIVSSQLWKTQTCAAASDYEADTIAICMIGDFTVKLPSKQQFLALKRLLQDLQKLCRIAPENIRFSQQLDANPAGRADFFVDNLTRRHLFQGATSSAAVPTRSRVE